MHSAVTNTTAFTTAAAATVLPATALPRLLLLLSPAPAATVTAAAKGDPGRLP